MEPQPHHIDEIVRYLRQQMSTEERAAFEQRLRKDEALQQEVTWQQDIARGIDLYGAENLKRQLQAVEREAARTKGGFFDPRKGRSLYLWLGVAASFSVLALMAIFFINQPADPQELYTEHFRPYPNVINPAQRSMNGPVDEADQAMYYYQWGEYEQAIELFTTEPALRDQAYRFYLGVSYLGIGQPEKALSALQPLGADTQGAFYEPALWYSGLARLLANQPEPAREIFRQIATSDGYYQAEARELLDELKE